MKESVNLYLVFALLLLPFSCKSDDSWHPTRYQTNNNLTGLYFCSEERGYVTDDIGDIFSRGVVPKPKSDSVAPRDVILNDIFFLPRCKNGFACGGKGTFLVTRDGGLNWAHHDFDSSQWLYDISFLDSVTGFLVGSSVGATSGMEGVAYRTEDGGNTWQSLSINGRSLNSIDIAPDGVITICGGEKTFISHDGGRNWEMSTAPAGRLARAAAVRKDRGIMVGMNGLMALSDDGGKTWTSTNSLGAQLSLFCLLMLDEKRAYAAGSEGTILYTEDSGQNWVPEESGAIEDLNDIQKVGHRIIACGRNGVIVFKDVGN